MLHLHFFLFHHFGNGRVLKRSRTVCAIGKGGGEGHFITSKGSNKLENKLVETRQQCSDLEATNAKQAEEIAGLLCNMEELSNTNV